MNQSDNDIFLERLLVAQPHGYCAGVEVAEKAAHQALEIVSSLGLKLYIKHKIVHNDVVMNRLLGKGAILVESIDEIPENSYVFFSAHGSPTKDYEEARRKNITIIDGTCGLVSKVHRAMIGYANKEMDIVYIGNKNHVEAIGATGQLPDKTIPVVYTKEEAEALDVSSLKDPVYLTQTTLSVDDTREIMEILRRKGVSALPSESICYATTERQDAIKKIAKLCDVIIILGSSESSNAKKLTLTAIKFVDAYLAQDLQHIEPSWFKGKKSLGLSSAASTPEETLEEAIKFFKPRAKKYDVIGEPDDVKFKLPDSLKELMQKVASD